MRRQDPPPVPQLAIPVEAVEAVHRWVQNKKSPRLHAIADLGIIAFYYLLRVGEYTKPKYAKLNGKRMKATRTVQFRLKDIGFFNNDTLIDQDDIPNEDLLESLLEATTAVLKISNQKNGRMGDTVSHESTGDDHIDGPTHAVARRVAHIRCNGGGDDALLSSYFENGQWNHVTQAEMVQAARWGVRLCGLHKKGIDPDLVGAHSYRAGGAMALKLHGYGDTTIMKFGRWSGLTFVMYIHSQIAHLSKGVSKQMKNRISFVNVGNINTNRE